MRCGKCEQTGVDLAHVRACYGVELSNYSKEGQDQSWRELPPKDRQLETLARLRKQTGQPAKFTGEITRGQASDEIGELIELAKNQRKIPEEAATALAAGQPPWNDAEPSRYAGVAARHNATVTHAATRPRTEDWPDVSEGWYATPSHTGSNDLDFWEVDVPSKDKGSQWAGYIFVKRIIGGRDSQRIRWEEQTVALEAIRAAGPQEAMELFGQKLGKCGKCGRHLTDETSRAIGIGPVCRAGGRD